MVSKQIPGERCKLADDHTLSAIDDEGAAIGHEGDLSHVDALLLGGFLLLQFEGDIERGTETFSLADGLQRIELGLADFVLDEVQ